MGAVTNMELKREWYFDEKSGNKLHDHWVNDVLWDEKQGMLISYGHDHKLSRVMFHQGWFVGLTCIGKVMEVSDCFFCVLLTENSFWKAEGQSFVGRNGFVVEKFMMRLSVPGN